MLTDQKIAIIGSGSWATAIAKMIHINVDKLHWYLREAKAIKHISKHSRNPLYLSSVKFDTSRLELHSDVNEAIASADIIVFCVPSKFLKSLTATITVSLKGKKVISAIKGIVPGENMLVSEYLAEKYALSKDCVGVVSGPCHAEEVALERLSYVTVASKSYELAEYFAKALQTYYIKTTISKDLVGIEYSAVLKNVMALATGICHGLGYGDNFTSVLISNAIQEIARFVDAVSPHEDRDINDSVYLGDLLVTAYSQFSRNRTFGTMIGKGYSVKSAELEMSMIAEGYYVADSIKQINDNYQVDMPIVEAVYNILYERYSPQLEIQLLSECLR